MRLQLSLACLSASKSVGMPRCEEEREYLKKQQVEVEHKLEAVCKTEADAKAEAKHAQLRYEDRDHELNERAALLRRQETELVRQPALTSGCYHIRHVP